MAPLLDHLIALFQEHGLSEATASFVARCVGLVLLTLFAVAANAVAKKVIVRAVAALARRSRWQWDNILVEAGVFTRLSHLAPAFAFRLFLDDVLGGTPEALAFANSFISVYLIIIVLLVASATLNAVGTIVARGPLGANIPVKGFVQAVKLVGTIVGGIFVLSVLFGKSPIYFFSGLGALTAVLLLVFRDALLGFVAGIQISVNQMVRVGDWIEMPKAGADGDVIDVSLTTVKVSNWDRTITTIPTYALISESFKNWRGMQEAGGRRIKRALNIDLNTVRFADEDQLARWQKIGLLRPYLEAKLAEIAEDNRRRGADLGVLGNGRRLTNLGTFRAYCVAYLRQHPKIHQEMTFLVRQLAPGEHGVPIEIYVFTNDIRWAFYEAIQADIFDHLIAMVPIFDLRVFQEPSGHDVHELVERLPAVLAPRGADAGGVEAAALRQAEGEQPCPPA
jgi:miniconductance mechanosensitive channel